MFGRAKEVAEGGVFTVWEDIGRFGVQDAEAQRASLGRLRGRLFSHQCASPNAGLSLLRQAYGNVLQNLMIIFYSNSGLRNPVRTFAVLVLFRCCVGDFNLALGWVIGGILSVLCGMVT